MVSLPRFFLAVLLLTAFSAKISLASEPSQTSLKVSGLLQGWFLNDNSAATSKANFRVRRAELKVSGSVAENTRFSLMMDGAKSLNFTDSTKDSKVLQEVGIGYSFTPALEFVVGQFKGLSTTEGLDSSTELLLPERSRVARKFGDKRKQGAQLHYRSPDWQLGAMISNGGEPNTNDASTAKELALRAQAETPVPGLQLAAFIQARDTRMVKDRDIGTSLRLSQKNFLIRGEFVTTRTEERHGEGWAADLGYRLYDEKLMPVVRYEEIRTDLNTDLVSRGWTLGMNAYIKNPQVKFQLSYSLLTNFLGNNGSYEESTATLARKTQLLIAAYSMAF
ncbi:MAG: hypothetical protein KGQ59_05310 [Bdellovibrionales bacterium]|nr:hypothetical protein [Bdellovibrionales bacterium]